MNIEKGMKLYDERNDRYLTVVSVNKGSKVALCDVLEHATDGEYYEPSMTELFTLNELGHFKEV